MNNLKKIRNMLFSFLIGLLCFSCANPTLNEVKFKITYSTSHGNAPEQVELVAGSKLEEKHLPNLESDGYSFGGWYDGNTKVTKDYIVKKDVTLTAKWTQLSVADVTFSPTDKEVVKGLNVTLSTTTKDAVIYYTLDNKEPTTNSTVYKDPIVIENDVTIKAIAVKKNYLSSNVTTVSYILKKPIIDSITSDKNRYLFGEDIKITIKGKKFDLIDSTTSSLKVGLYEKGTSTVLVAPQICSIDNATNSATLTTKVLLENAASLISKNGCGFITAKLLLNDKLLDKEIEFYVSAKPSIYKEPVITSDSIIHKDSLANPIVNFDFYGLAFDLAKKVEVQLFKNNGTEKVGTPIDVDISKVSSESTKFSVPILVPNIEGEYLIKVLIDSVVQEKYYYSSKESQLSDYKISVIPSIEITELRIPRAGKSCAGQDITFVIKGKNLISTDTFDIKLNDTPLTSPATFEYFNPTTIKATMKIPNNVGEYTIKVKNNNIEKVGTLEVKDFSSYKIGDIILKDGTKKSNEDFSTFDETLAIIGGFNNFGVPLAFALYNFDDPAFKFDWSTSNVNTYNEAINTIQGTTERNNFYNFTKVDVWGNDNWEEIKEADPEGTKNAATNYPVFDFVTTFAANNNITSEYYNKGWFLPSITELINILQNIETIDTMLEKMKGCQPLGKIKIWSSTTRDFLIYKYQVYFCNTRTTNKFSSQIKCGVQKNHALPVHEVF